MAGGRSRLHLLDLGSCSKSSKDSSGIPNSGALSLGALGTVILALLNGQRHVPYRHSKLTQLIRDSLASSLSCRTCMIAHVSPSPAAYNETLQVIQLAAKIHRSRPRHTGSSRAQSKVTRGWDWPAQNCVTFMVFFSNCMCRTPNRCGCAVWGVMTH